MATVTQVTTGSISTGTSISLTGVSGEAGDLFLFCASSYGTFGISSISGTPINDGRMVFINTFTGVSTGSTPNIWGEFWPAFCTGSFSSTTFTVGNSSSAPAAVILFRVRPDKGKKIIFRRSTIENFSNLASTSRTISTDVPMTNDTVLIGSFAVADDTFITDSDTLNGSWSSVFYRDSTASTDLAVFGQSKIVIGSGQQTYGGSWANGQSEYAVGFLAVLYEIGLPHWGVLNL